MSTSASLQAAGPNADKPERRRVRAPIPEQVDVAIIGSGIGGLMAGASLAKQGLRVAVFEAHYVSGGCATQFRRRGPDGVYHFDVGLHYIGECQPGGRIPSMLAEVGVSGSNGVDFVAMDQDGFDTLVLPDLQFRIPANIDLYRDRLLALFPRERRGIDRYMSLLRAVMYVSSRSAGGGTPGLRTLLGLGTDALVLAQNREATIGQFLDTCTRDPWLRAVLLGQNGDYGVPPSEASAFLHMGLCAHYFSGAFYPRGGGQVIADQLTAAIERFGGTVHLRHPVERIEIEGGRAVGLRLEAKTPDEPATIVRARNVLSNADLLVTLNRLVGREHLPSDWQSRLDSYHMADAIFITFLGIRGDMQKRGMRATNYWQFDGYDFDAFYRAGRQPDADGKMQAGGCYITSATLKDPESALHHAPAGISNVEVMTVVPGSPSHWGAKSGDAEAWRYRHNERYQRIKQGLEEQMIARLDALFPGSAQNVVYRESATPLSHSRFTRATDGTGYGLAATPEQFLAGRPGTRGPVAGLYLTGASTRSGHGIMGAMLGGKQAARRILRDLSTGADGTKAS